MISMALQSGVDPRLLSEQLRGIGRSCPDVLEAEDLVESGYFGPGPSSNGVADVDLCPACGAAVRREPLLRWWPASATAKGPAHRGSCATAVGPSPDAVFDIVVSRTYPRRGR